MLDRIRSVRNKTLSPFRKAPSSQLSSHSTSPMQASSDQSTSQSISSGIPLSRLGSTTQGESSHEAQDSSTLPPISNDSQAASSAQFVSLDARSDSTIPVIQVVDSSQDMHSDEGHPLAQSVDENPAPAPTSLGEDRRRVAYEAFKTTLGTLNVL